MYINLNEMTVLMCNCFIVHEQSVNCMITIIIKYYTEYESL